MSEPTMRAAQYPTSGADAGRVEVVDVERPQPAAGEVLVRVHVAGVNPTDWKSRGRMDGSAPYPHITPLQDGAGVVEAVGDGVDPARAGERVWLFHSQWQRARGAAAQYIAIASEQAVALPDGVSFDVGAGLAIPYMTAQIALDGVEAGDFVLVHGGAGAVGHAAIELANRAGARVATTVSSPEKAQLAREAGAELIVNYREQDVAEAVAAWAEDGVRRIVEVALERNLADDVEVLADGGTIVDYVGGLADGGLPGRELMTKNARLRFLLVYTTPPEVQLAATRAINAALAEGALTPLPVHRFALDNIAQALDAVEGGAVGKVLVDIP